MRRLDITKTSRVHPTLPLIFFLTLLVGCEVEILFKEDLGSEVPVIYVPKEVPAGPGIANPNRIIRDREEMLAGRFGVDANASMRSPLAGQGPKGFGHKVIAPVESGGAFGMASTFEVDMNCDNHLDMVVGEPNLFSGTGRVSIYYGGPNGFSASPDVKLFGTVKGAMFGFGLAGGQVSSGCGALLVNALKGDGGRGKNYLFLGKKNLGNRQDVGLTGADYMFVLSALSAGASERLGPGLAMVDLDGDGLKDLFFGHFEKKVGSGFARVLGLMNRKGLLRPLGQGETTRPVVISKEADVIVAGGKYDDSFGLVLRNLGKISGGNAEALYIGAYTAGAFTVGGITDYPGRAYILLGAAGKLASPTININTSPRVVHIDGVPGGTSGFGFDAAAVKNFGGSGLWVLISSPYDRVANQKHAGRARLFNVAMMSGLLKATQSPITIENDIPGAAGDLFSRGPANAALCAASTADINGDGYVDVVLSSLNTGYLGRSSVLVFYGGQSKGLLKVSGADLRWIGSGTSFGLRNAYTLYKGQPALCIAEPYGLGKGMINIYW